MTNLKIKSLLIVNDLAGPNCSTFTAHTLWESLVQRVDIG